MSEFSLYFFHPGKKLMRFNASNYPHTFIIMLLYGFVPGSLISSERKSTMVPKPHTSLNIFWKKENNVSQNHTQVNVIGKTRLIFLIETRDTHRLTEFETSQRMKTTHYNFFKNKELVITKNVIQVKSIEGWLFRFTFNKYLLYVEDKS